MPVDWKSYCKTPDLTVEGDSVTVLLEDQRRQQVYIETAENSFHLHSIVARPAAVSNFPDAEIRAWMRNRSMHLVSFRLDSRSRMIGEAWVHLVGVTKEEFLLYLRTVAIECDRFEYQITGRDDN